MKDEEIVARAQELAVLFADIPDDVLMRFVNRNGLVCNVFSRAAILRALACKSNTGREQLNASTLVSGSSFRRNRMVMAGSVTSL